MLNLLTDDWLPAVRRGTGPCLINPSRITENHAEDPVIAIDWPRPDLRIATLELLIGLLATAFPPGGRDDWLRKWHQPPTPDQLAGAFSRFTHAFELDGDGPRFLQDREDLDSGAEPVQRLLIEAPGDSTIKKNTDLMVHRDGVTALGRPAAAIALHAFQSWAPAGGAGNRTGLRGGGPLVTLVVPGDTPALWHLLWANVPVREDPLKREDFPRVFPWLTQTPGSKDGHVVTPENAHPLQCWWGMPRRIRLDFTALGPDRPARCRPGHWLAATPAWRELRGLGQGASVDAALPAEEQPGIAAGASAAGGNRLS